MRREKEFESGRVRCVRYTRTLKNAVPQEKKEKKGQKEVKDKHGSISVSNTGERVGGRKADILREENGAKGLGNIWRVTKGRSQYV